MGNPWTKPGSAIPNAKTNHWADKVASSTAVPAVATGTVASKKGSLPEVVQNAFSEGVILEGVQAPTSELDLVRVPFSLGLTVNLGNFQSLRVDVGITVPTTPAGSTEAFKAAAAWVADRLQRIVEAHKASGQ